MGTEEAALLRVVGTVAPAVVLVKPVAATVLENVPPTPLRLPLLSTHASALLNCPPSENGVFAAVPFQV